MGDTSDNIPGVPGVGEKTAINLVKKYKSIDNLYKELENGTDTERGKLRERLVENKDLAFLSRTLGTINREVPMEEKIDDLKVKEWDKEKVFEKFKELNFNRFIERFSLQAEQQEKDVSDLVKIEEINLDNISNIIDKIKQYKELIYLLNKEEIENKDKIIKKDIKAIAI